MDTIYILKTKGTGQIPDYIQFRDINMVLLTHSVARKPQNAIKSLGLEDHQTKIQEIIKNLPYGKAQKLEL